MDGLSLGIDTSNYTTSIALAGANGEVVYEKGILLQVKTCQYFLRVFLKT